MESIKFNLSAVFFTIGAVQGYFLAIILFSLKRGKKAANRTLAFLLLTYSLILTEYIISIAGHYERLPHIIFTTSSIWYLLGPLFYYYIRFLLSIPSKFRIRDIIHLIPFIISFTMISPFYFLDAQTKILLLNQGQNELFSLIMQIMYVIQVPIYLMLSVKLIKIYESQYKNNESYTSLIHIGWLRSLLLIMITPVIHDFVSFIYQYKTGSVIPELSYSTMTIYIILIHSLAYLVIQQPEKIFPEMNLSGEKYKTSALSEAERKSIIEKLETLMSDEKPYISDDLKLADLSQMLSISPHHLSQILNQEMGVTFYEYINDYRVNEVKERLIDSSFENFTLLAIALDVGFNNKTSFNRIFKKKTGITPSAYIKFKQSAQSV